MGRRRKKSHNGLRNLGIISLAVVVGVYAKLNFFNGDFQMPEIKMPSFFQQSNNESRISEDIVPDEITIPDINKPKVEKQMVKVFFIKQSNGKEVYKIIKKENNTDTSDVEYAVKSLLSGPSKYSKGKGAYSEIPPNTKLISFRETPTKIIINVSEAFENTDGADSLYKRMYQLIKTVNSNTDKPAYLEINGHLVETLGGDGLMIKQPLNGSSLDD